MNNRNNSNANDSDQTNLNNTITVRGRSSGDESSPNEPVLTREFLQIVWNRMQSINNSERSSIINTIALMNQRRRASEEDEEQHTRTRYRYYDEDAESQDEMNNPEEEEEYFDFRSYPLPIDWSAVEDDKSEAYDIMDRYGYFGVALFTKLTSNSSLKLTSSKFVTGYIEYYYNLVKKLETTPGHYDKLTEFISKLPSLSKLRELINKELITPKELVVIKTILDLYEHYLINYDCPYYEILREYISTALLFYSSLSDEDIHFIHDTLEKNFKSSLDILSNNLNCINGEKQSQYMKHLRQLESKYSSKFKGVTPNKFIL